MFKEKQKFDQWWLTGLFYAGLGLCIYAAVQQLLYKIPFGNNPAPDELLIMFIVFFLIFFVLFRMATLITEIDDHQIRYRFFPFQRNFKVIDKKDTKKVEIITYRPIADFGGWGVRVGRKGLAYNVSGNQGLYITFENNRNLLIGTQKEDELEEFLRNHGWLSAEEKE